MFRFCVGFIIIIAIGSSLGCDPCKQLAEYTCECYETQQERALCVEQLKLAEGHEYFDEAKDRSICEEAQKNCTCKKILNKDDEQCGAYRLKR